VGFLAEKRLYLFRESYQQGLRAFINASD